MSFRGMIFGDPERRRRKKQQEDLDAGYYKRRIAYNEAKQKERERLAAIRGTQDAQNMANQKPFYQKVIGAVEWLGKDLVDGAAKVNPDALFTWEDTPTQQPAKKHRKRRRNRD